MRVVANREDARPIIAAWGVVDDDQDGKLVYIRLEKGGCEHTAHLNMS